MRPKKKAQIRKRIQTTCMIKAFLCVLYSYPNSRLQKKEKKIPRSAGLKSKMAKNKRCVPKLPKHFETSRKVRSSSLYSSWGGPITWRRVDGPKTFLDVARQPSLVRARRRRRRRRLSRKTRRRKRKKKTFSYADALAQARVHIQAGASRESEPGRSVRGERTNFAGLVLGCIEANFARKYALELGSIWKEIEREVT